MAKTGCGKSFRKVETCRWRCHRIDDRNEYSCNSGGYEQLMQLPGGQSTFSAIQCTLLKLSKTSEESHSYWNKIQAISKENGVASCSEDSINVVFVLGESFIKAHSSLYGYPLKTMPNMEKEKEKEICSF